MADGRFEWFEGAAEVKVGEGKAAVARVSVKVVDMAMGWGAVAMVCSQAIGAEMVGPEDTVAALVAGELAVAKEAQMADLAAVVALVGRVEVKLAMEAMVAMAAGAVDRVAAVTVEAVEAREEEGAAQFAVATVGVVGVALAARDEVSKGGKEAVPVDIVLGCLAKVAVEERAQGPLVSEEVGARVQVALAGEVEALVALGAAVAWAAG